MTSAGLPGVVLAAKNAYNNQHRPLNSVSPKIYHPAAFEPAAATIGLIFAGALSVPFDQER